MTNDYLRKMFQFLSRNFIFVQNKRQKKLKALNEFLENLNTQKDTPVEYKVIKTSIMPQREELD